MSEIALATLIEVSPRNSPLTLRYQNYQQQPFFWDGQDYALLGFEVQSYPAKDLSIGGEDLKLAIRNTPIVRELLAQYDGLRRARCRVLHLQPGVAGTPVGYRRVISFASYQDSVIIFVLRPATNALSGRLITKYIEAKDFPELPYYRPQL